MELYVDDNKYSKHELIIIRNYLNDMLKTSIYDDVEITLEDFITHIEVHLFEKYHYKCK